MTGFEKFGKHGYVSQSKINTIIDYLEKGELMGTQCEECNSLYFPPRADCPRCRGDKMTWLPIDNKCKLITFTEVHFGPPEFQKDTPYILGLAEMDQGTRIFAPISEGFDKTTLKPGLELTLRPTKDQHRVYYRLEKKKDSTSG